VISELWHNDPEATFQTARRMFADGADRHDIIHALVQAQDSPAAQPAQMSAARQPASGAGCGRQCGSGRPGN
jgi:hypothetical protein